MTGWLYVGAMLLASSAYRSACKAMGSMLKLTTPSRARGKEGR